MTLHSPNLLQKITNLKLDIIDHTKKKLHIFELTVPLATNMEQMGMRNTKISTIHHRHHKIQLHSELH